MAQQLKFLIDGIDRGQPLNPEEFAITINLEDSIGARVVSFNNDLTFGGDVYSYLYKKLETNGYCELVNLRVQYKCASGTWEPLVDGYIIVTECLFMIDRCQVKTKMYDETFSTKINNNKSIPFSLDLTTTKNGKQITPPTLRRLEVFTPGTGVILPLCAYGYPVYDVFKHLVGCMSDNLVDFESDYFKVIKPDFNVPAYTVGKSLRERTIQQMSATFEQLYTAMRSKLNLGMGFEKQANGRPLLRIEPASYFEQTGASANLYDQPGIELTFDREKLYQAVDFGNDVVLEAQECDGGNTPCTFTQTPFRGFRNETFGFTGECNTSNKLNLQTPKIIFDANAIEDVVRFAVEDYDNDNFIIQCFFIDFGVNPDCLVSQQFDPYDIQQYVYNGNFANNEVSQNWIAGYPNSLYSFLQPFNPSSTIFLARATVNTQCWDVDDDQFYSYLQVNGIFLDYPNEISDPGNNFNGSTYTVPYTGIYTFSAIIQLDGLSLVSGNKIGFASIKQYNSADQFVQSIDGPQITSVAIEFSQLTVTATMLCNVGDLIRTDVSVKIVDPGPLASQCVLYEWTDLITGVVYKTQFSGSGQPLSPLELQPVNIDDVKAYIYKFNRPLTMAEINAITSETSKPISIGRYDDPLAVIPTYIKTLNIESVMRKNTTFELLSNKLLP
jgi:hypothetical protein